MRNPALLFQKTLPHVPCRLSVLLAAMLLVSACTPTTPAQPPAAQQPATTPDPDFEAMSAADRAAEDAERHRRYVADILYDGLRALRADRLMTPPEDSAYHYFNRALALDPGNTVALDGMADILQRYLQLADTAAWQGQFDNAEQFLRRAGQVDPQHPGIAQARTRLNTERERTHSVHVLDPRQLRSRDSALVDRLRALAATVVQADAFVLITAPNDEMGRWIYAQMQDALTEVRLRGDIEIGESPTVRLVVNRNS